MTSTQEPAIRPAALGIVVSDMAAALAFYRRLGVDLPPEADAAPHADAELPGGFRLMFDTEEVARAVHPGWEPAKGGQQLTLAFDCGTPAGVDAVYAALTGAGHRGHREPWDAVWGQRYAMVLDPDGTVVDLYAAS